MLDLLLFAEIAWCTVLISAQGPRRALLYSGGVLTSGFAASQLSGWLARVLLPVASQSFLWLQSQISLDTQNAAVLSGFIPAEPVLSGLPNSSWITEHIVKTMFYIGITVAVFLLFIVVDYLYNALYDRPQSPRRRGERVLTPLLAMGTGVYLALLTGVLLGNLAWLQQFTPLTHSAAHSLSMHWIQRLLAALPRT